MDLLQKHGIQLRRYRAGNNKTTCPRCSHLRRHKADPCLSVLIGEGEVKWRCHNCAWKGGDGGRSAEAGTGQAARSTGIDIELAVRLGVESSSKAGFDICIPYRQGGKLVNRKYRTLGPEKRFMQDAGAVKCFWNYDAITDQTLAAEPLIITEGEMDAIIAMQCGFRRVVSVPDGAPAEKLRDTETAKYSYIADAADDLSQVQSIILAIDADAAGANLLHDLSLRLGKAYCRWIAYPKGCKDLNETFLNYGLKGVEACFTGARYVDVNGVHRLSELPPLPERRSYDIGLPVLGNHYRLRGGDLTVITGIALPDQLIDLRLALHCERLHRLGPRATYELMAEICGELLPQIFVEDIRKRLERFAALDPNTVSAVGADRIPRPPLTLVPPEKEPERQPTIGLRHIAEIVEPLVERSRPMNGRGA